jgi:calcium-dependent protein kinase
LSDFVKNFEIFQNLNHPNLCRVLEIYEDEHHFYLINELLSGLDVIDVMGSRDVLTEKDTANITK